MRLTKDCKYVLDQFIAHPPESPGEIYDYVVWAQFIDENRLTVAQYRGVLETLESARCIKWLEGSSVKFYLLDAGRNYKELHRADVKEAWWNGILGFFAGVLATVVAQLIINCVG